MVGVVVSDPIRGEWRERTFGGSEKGGGVLGGTSGMWFPVGVR